MDEGPRPLEMPTPTWRDLEMAAERRDAELMARCVTAGVPITAQCLHAALPWLDGLRYLLEHGGRAAINDEVDPPARFSRDRERDTDRVLHRTVWWGRRTRQQSATMTKSTIELLLAHRASIATRGRDNLTPLAMAVEFLCLPALRPLLSAGASIREWPHYGRRALPVSVTRPQRRLARCRLAQRAVERTGRVHKDVVPAVLTHMWTSRFDEAWDDPAAAAATKRARLH